MPEHNADLVILGGGSGGYACALRAAELGMSVVLVERDKLGGTCLHYGCIPTKALLHAAEVADSAREGDRIGVKSSLSGIDMAGVNSYKDGVVAKLYKGLQGLVKSRKIEFVAGEGRFEAPNVVTVDGDRYVGAKVVLATGSYARTLPGLEIGGRVITSNEALRLEEVPRSVDRARRRRDRRRVRVGVQELRGGRHHRRGVAAAGPGRGRVRVEAPGARVPQAQDRLQDRREVHGGRSRATPGSRCRWSPARTSRRSTCSSPSDAGRTPPTPATRRRACGWSAASCSPTTGCARNLPDVYAVGDIVPGLQLAHRGFQQGIFIAEDIAGLKPPVIDESGIPRVTYCEPEVASVGLTEAQARERYGEVQTLTYDLAGNGKSQILQTQGAIKLVKAGGEGTPARWSGSTWSGPGSAS